MASTSEISPNFVRAVLRGLALVLVCLGNPAAAQDTEELRNLVFEPVALAGARANPLELGASSADVRELSSAVTEHLAAIEELRQARSAGAELVERLGLVAVAYQGMERHEEAIGALDEAVSIVRRESGRNTLDQIPLQEQKIPSYLALNDIDSIDETEELIFSLKERSFDPGGREMYHATATLADWYTAAYYRENFGAGNNTLRRQMAVLPRVQRCIHIPGVTPRGECETNAIFTGAIKDVAESDIIDARLRKIDRLYTRYQDDIIDGGNVQLDIILDLGRRVARLAFAAKQEMDFERNHNLYDPNYEGTMEQARRNSPERMAESYLTGERALNYAISFPSSVANFRPEALAAALLDLGDWHLAYGKAAAAEDAYGKAYQVLLDAGFTAENIDVALTTQLPVQIPVFVVHLFTLRSTGIRESSELVFRGYVDLTYELDSLGNASNLQFLGSSTDDVAAIERLLERQFKSAKFRPLLDAGELVSPGRIEARYYYAY